MTKRSVTWRSWTTIEVRESGQELVVVVPDPVAAAELLVPGDVVEVGALTPGLHDLVEVALDLRLDVLVDELDAGFEGGGVGAHDGSARRS
jgi:hypothetical protein